MDTNDSPSDPKALTQNQQTTQKPATEKQVVDFQTARSPHLLLKKEKKVAETRAAFEKYYPTNKVVKKTRKKSKPLKK